MSNEIINLECILIDQNAKVPTLIADTDLYDVTFADCKHMMNELCWVVSFGFSLKVPKFHYFEITPTEEFKKLGLMMLSKIVVTPNSKDQIVGYAVPIPGHNVNHSKARQKMFIGELKVGMESKMIPISNIQSSQGNNQNNQGNNQSQNQDQNNNQNGQGRNSRNSRNNVDTYAPVGNVNNHNNHNNHNNQGYNLGQNNQGNQSNQGFQQRNLVQDYPGNQNGYGNNQNNSRNVDYGQNNYNHNNHNHNNQNLDQNNQNQGSQNYQYRR